jgi:probable HAF family extracellular repeat protein
MVAVPQSPAAMGQVTIIEHPGSTNTRPVGINAHGVISGDYDSAADGLRYTFVLEAGEFRPAPVPGPWFATLAKINASGDLVGIHQPPGTTNLRGYLARNGEIFDINVPDARGTTPSGINDRGDIVGSYRDQAGATHAFLYSQGEYTSFDVPASWGNQTAALDINAQGEIVGRYQTGPTVRMFLLSRGEFTPIDVPDAVSTGAMQNGAGINARGEIVGQFVDSLGRVHGFVRDQHGNYEPIDIPGALETRAVGIDDSGNVIGRYRPVGATRNIGFLLHR